MASFSIIGYSTAAQTLAGGENGFVTTSGTLYTETAIAVTITGTSSLTVLGTVATAEGAAAVRTSGTIGSIDVVVGVQGSIISSMTDGLRLAASGAVNLTNNGLIQGDRAIYIDGDGTAVGTIWNTGRIVGIVQIGAVGNFILNNAGLITGSLDLSGGYYRVNNFGTITGNIYLSSGRDFFTNDGGQVMGDILGNDGDDVFWVDRSDLDINGGIGDDVMYSSVSNQIADEVETLNLTGNLGLVGLGRNFDDKISGSQGNDTIEGRRGNDSLNGNQGDDLVYGGGGNDTLTLFDGDDRLFGGAGIDLFNVTGDSGDLTINLALGFVEDRDNAGEVIRSATLERIENATGGSDNDRITGTASSNVLNGNVGNDTLVGGAGNDLLEGWSGNDSLLGGADADTLIGGTWADILTGGGGADVFRYLTKNDSFTGNVDRITDFSLAQDKIDFAAVDADTVAAGDQAFTFVGTQAFAGTGAQLRYVQDAGTNTTTLELRLANSAAVDMVIVLNGLHNLAADSFLL